MPGKVSWEVMLGFLEEANGYLPIIRKGLNEYLADPTTAGGLEEAYRLTHIIKGASSMVGLAEISHQANCVEAVLEELVYGQRSPEERIAEIETTANLLVEMDVIERELQQVVGRRDELDPEKSSSRASAETAAASVEPSGITDEEVASVEEEMPAIDPEMLEVYTMEAEDHLSVITSGLAKLERNSADRDTLHEVRRSVHTLKGAAAVVGFRIIAKLAHRMEDLLDQLFEQDAAISTSELSVLLAGTEALETLGRGTPPAAMRVALQDLHRRLDGFVTTKQSPATDEVFATEQQRSEAALVPLEAEQAIEVSADASVVTTARQEEAVVVGGGKVVRVPLTRLDSLVKLVSEMVISRTVLEQRVMDLEKEVEELQHSSQRLKNVAYQLEGDYEASALGSTKLFAGAVGGGHSGGGRGITLNPTSSTAVLDTPGGSSGSGGSNMHGFDELEFDRYTAFHQLTRELKEATSDTGAVANEMGIFLGDFEGILTRQRRLSNEIQNSLMRVRMLPLRVLATRLHRTVRVTADQDGKKVDLVIDGEAVEMDTTVIEQIVDPLLHLIRNSIGHGIESPEIRQRAGKPVRGTIRLSAYHEANSVVLEVGDDGGGLNLSAIRDKAARMGLLTSAKPATLSEKETQQLIFMPGFSTAAAVTEVSGRGVGMDVVRDTVKKLQGTIGIDSTPGQGTKFTLRLPMTLTVTRSLIVQVSGRSFAVPLNAVRQILRVDAEQVEKISEERVLRQGNTTYPVVYLAEALGMAVSEEASESNRLRILLMRMAGGESAVVVDRIVEGREVVIKPLGNHLRHVRGIMGATLLGDGRVIPILNPADLGGEDVAAPGESFIPVSPTVASATQTLTVMVVYDSPSIRRINAGLIKSAGWVALTAKDGLDALEQLHKTKEMPNVMLLDVEMRVWTAMSCWPR